MSAPATVATWFSKLQYQAGERFAAMPSPIRTDEHWRYGSVKQAEAMLAIESVAALSDADKGRALSESTSTLEAAVRLIFANDELLNPEALGSLPEGVTLVPLLEAASRMPELMQEHFMARETSLGGIKFSQMHQARTRAGIVLHVAKGVQMEKPIEVFHWIGGRGSVFPHTLIVSEPNSQITVLEHQRSLDDEEQGVVAVTDLHARDGAKIIYGVVQDLNLKSRAVHLTSASVHKAATATALLMNLGAAWVRNESVSRMEGAGAESYMLGVSSPHDTQEVDQRTFQHHAAPRAKSDLLYKNVLDDQARTVFSGLIFVDEGAHYTDAYQTCRNLLNSDTCEANSMPGLEINADQVKCSHGSTSSPVDKDELFYLMARGIPDQASRTLITLGFLEDVFTRLNHEALQTAVCQRLEEKFAVPF